MRIAAAARRLHSQQPSGAAGSWVLLKVRQVPVPAVAWLRALIFALLVALVVVAIGYLLLRVARRREAEALEAPEEPDAGPPAPDQGP
eukprot:CAMPEP_0204560480 /NCGR_PEP_ID=MMETSP0661-20131031/32644_1 /ASSEMBLY_ACC=CAM_ASM_000606 /TAXON_ID=109239 /ORGANISM="Alexandrium margalefi, Strain AMGDE01CS-322" /LENGTH=87 /DNA_ID=CAMNT_0051567817 /DNA_START=66 /DNA_END=326 /DNA_ORIENTATION=+